jgi:hypothetical protein
MSDKTIVGWLFFIASRPSGPFLATTTIAPERSRKEPEGFFEKAGDALGIPSGRVEGDLKRFRDFIEEKGMETDRRRGPIERERAQTPPLKSLDKRGSER